jgi:hypothetical protein
VFRNRQEKQKAQVKERYDWVLKSAGRAMVGESKLANARSLLIRKNNHLYTIPHIPTT